MTTPNWRDTEQVVAHVQKIAHAHFHTHKALPTLVFIVVGDENGAYPVLLQAGAPDCPPEAVVMAGATVQQSLPAFVVIALHAVEDADGNKMALLIATDEAGQRAWGAGMEGGQLHPFAEIPNFGADIQALANGERH